ETRNYNSLLQLTQISVGGANLQYNYSTTQNNGRIVSAVDGISGETIVYGYDALNRLISASATMTGTGAASWSQSYGYDGFGNMGGVDPSTNRVAGWPYDANGNAAFAGYAYDAENRLTQVPDANVAEGVRRYYYDGSNKRVAVTDGDGNILELNFYGLNGRR